MKEIISRFADFHLEIKAQQKLADKACESVDNMIGGVIEFIDVLVDERREKRRPYVERVKELEDMMQGMVDDWEYLKTELN